MQFRAVDSFAVFQLSERRLPPLRSVLALGGFACMKVQRHIAGGLLAVAASLFVSVCCRGLAAEASTNSNAPTGLYVSDTLLPATFIVRLGTNGDYQVCIEGGALTIGSQSQQGQWKWDGRRQEFLLTPMTNTVAFPYEFRRLRVAPHQSDTLQWIPHHGGATGGPGVIDYISFKRQKK